MLPSSTCIWLRSRCAPRRPAVGTRADAAPWSEGSAALEGRSRAGNALMMINRDQSARPRHPRVQARRQRPTWFSATCMATLRSPGTRWRSCAHATTATRRARLVFRVTVSTMADTGSRPLSVYTLLAEIPASVFSSAGQHSDRAVGYRRCPIHRHGVSPSTSRSTSTRPWRTNGCTRRQLAVRLCARPRVRCSFRTG